MSHTLNLVVDIKNNGENVIQYHSNSHKAFESGLGANLKHKVRDFAS